MNLATESASPSRGAIGPKATAPSHPCRLCGRIYERADHLSRHLKSHENARPHKCTRCTKSFNRVDLLNRHQAGHDRQGSDKLSIERGERVAAACSACVAAKAKCQDQKPCARCERRGISCERPANNNSIYVVPISHSSGRNTSTSKHSSHNKDVRSRSHDHRQQSPEQGQNGTTVQCDPNLTSNPPQGEHEIVDSLFDNQGHAEDIIREDSANHNMLYGEQPLPSSLNQTFLEPPDFSYLPENPQLSLDMHVIPLESYFSQDLDFGMWDIDLDSVDISFPSFDDAQLQKSNNKSDATQVDQGQRDVSKRYAAFERSPWLWTPTQKDQALNDQHHLNLDEDAIPPVLTPASSPIARLEKFTSCHISHRQRDQMLSLLFTLGRPARSPPRFPSLSLLNSVIQVYFVQESFRFDSLIHIGSFSPSKTLPHLLTAIVSAGSTLISIPAIWKMGFALQEVVRHTVAEFWEEDNRNTRNLQALQAFMIGLDIGLWSGFRRNMELAESFGQPIVIMLRRAGAFAATRNDSSLVPSYSDSELSLESKWRKWVEKESFKRLVLHLFIHDVQASIGLQKPPLISFTELKLSLPVSRAIWSAETAAEWRDLSLSIQPESSPLPSFLDVMQRPETLHRLSSHVDVHLTAMTLLHGYWGQISSLMESKNFFPITKSTHRLAILTSNTELYRDISIFSQHLPSLTRNCSEALLLSELFMMILHISPDDLQRFAGKYGEDEARKAGQGFSDWARTSEARIAVWHAGQIFRAAKLLMPAKNRGFNTIALYFASLTLWVYGLMTSGSLQTDFPMPQNLQHTTTSGSNAQQQQHNIFLDGSDSIHAQTFRETGQGLPGILIVDGETERFVELKYSDKVLAAARDIYKNNYPVSDEPLPPLVENLGNLLRDLGTMPSRYGSRAPSEGPA